MIKILSDPSTITGTASYTVTDDNKSLCHAVRQTLLRDIKIFSFGNVKILTNESKIQDELLAACITRLNLNQSKVDPKKTHKLTITAEDDYVPVYASDITGTTGYFAYDKILLCVLAKGESVKAEMDIVEYSKRTAEMKEATAFRAISAIGEKDGVYTGTLLECLTIKELLDRAIKYITNELNDFMDYMKKYKSPYNLKGGYIFKQVRYDYVILNAVVEEIHIMADIHFCACKKPHPAFPETHFLIYDTDGKDLDIMDAAVKSLIKKITS